MSLTGASVSVAMTYVAVAPADVFPLFPGDSGVNAAPAEAVRTMMIALLLYVVQSDKWLLLLCFCLVCVRYVQDIGRYLLRGLT